MTSATDGARWPTARGAFCSATLGGLLAGCNIQAPKCPPLGPQDIVLSSEDPLTYDADIARLSMEVRTSSAEVLGEATTLLSNGATGTFWLREPLEAVVASCHFEGTVRVVLAFETPEGTPVDGAEVLVPVDTLEDIALEIPVDLWAGWTPILSFTWWTV